MDTFTYNQALDRAQKNNHLSGAWHQSVSTTGNFKKLWQGDLSAKKIVYFGNSTVGAAYYFYQQIAALSAVGQPLHGFTLTPIVSDPNNQYLVVNAGNLSNQGHNGLTLSGMIQTGAQLDTAIALAPDLFMVRGPLINDVRQGGCSLIQAKTMIQQMLSRIITALPNTCILFNIENCLGIDESDSIITAVQTTGSIGGDQYTPGKYTVNFNSVRPISIDRVGQRLIIAKGTSNEEVVTITALTDTTFEATFAKAHVANYTIQADRYGTSQAYTSIIRNACLPFANSYNQLIMMDMQTLIYGLEPHSTDNTLKTDVLHPSQLGQFYEANLVAKVIHDSQYGFF